MNWNKLRLRLREKFKNEFSFYNDKYPSGTRRIKICCNRVKANEMKQFILEQDSTLNVKVETLTSPYTCVGIDYVMVRYSE